MFTDRKMKKQWYVCVTEYYRRVKRIDLHKGTPSDRSKRLDDKYGMYMDDYVNRKHIKQACVSITIEYKFP